MTSLQKILIKSLPYTIYFEQVSLVILTKGVAQLQEMTEYVQTMYYTYLASVYIVQALRVILTKFLSGYSRGYWLTVVSGVQLLVQFILIVVSISSLLQAVYRDNFLIIWWQFFTVFDFWFIISSFRTFFIVQVILHVFKKKYEDIEFKEAFWLLMTTKDEVYEKKGGLIYDPREDLTPHSQSLISQDIKHTQK